MQITSNAFAGAALAAAAAASPPSPGAPDNPQTTSSGDPQVGSSFASAMLMRDGERPPPAAWGAPEFAHSPSAGFANLGPTSESRPEGTETFFVDDRMLGPMPEGWQPFAISDEVPESRPEGSVTYFVDDRMPEPKPSSLFASLFGPAPGKYPPATPIPEVQQGGDSPGLSNLLPSDPNASRPIPMPKPTPIESGACFSAARLAASRPVLDSFVGLDSLYHHPGLIRHPSTASDGFPTILKTTT